MANRVTYRNIATEDVGLQYFEGNATFSGSLTNGVVLPSTVGISHTITGTKGAGTAGIAHLGTGSYAVVLAGVYPRLQSAQFTLSLPDPSVNMRVVHNPNTTFFGPLSIPSGSAQTSQVGFWLLSGSTGAVMEPTGTIKLNVSIAVKNSSV